MIRYFGYPVEEHHVTTEDGYILSLQRIPKGKKGVPPNGGVVFLQHGLVSSSADYVMNLPDNSLGFILADLGYDVWLGNSRGNTYSNKHVNMSIHDPKFWAFRFAFGYLIFDYFITSLLRPIPCWWLDCWFSSTCCQTQCITSFHWVFVDLETCSKHRHMFKTPSI